VRRPGRLAEFLEANLPNVIARYAFASIEDAAQGAAETFPRRKASFGKVSRGRPDADGRVSRAEGSS